MNSVDESSVHGQKKQETLFVGGAKRQVDPKQTPPPKKKKRFFGGVMKKASHEAPQVPPASAHQARLRRTDQGVVTDSSLGSECSKALEISLFANGPAEVSLLRFFLVWGVLGRQLPTSPRPREG